MKTPFTLTLFFVLLSGICGALPTDSSLFAHWTFDGTTDDFTYRANHLAHMDGSWHTPTYKPGRDSVANKAIQLASYGCKVISYIPSEENKPLQLDSGSNSWSVAAWVVSGLGYLVGNRNIRTFDDSILLENTGQFSIGISSYKRIKVTLVDPTGALHAYETDTLYDSKKWSHICVVVDKDKDSLMVYLNALKIFSDKLVPMQQQKALFTVGGMYQFDTLTMNGWGGTTWRFINMFHGNVDDMRIYTKKLSGNEVQQLYLNDFISGLHEAHYSPFTGRVFPNPASGYLQLESAEVMEAVEAYSVTGNLVLSKQPEASSAVLDVQALAAGAYVLVIKTATGSYLQQVIKQ